MNPLDPIRSIWSMRPSGTWRADALLRLRRLLPGLAAGLFLAAGCGGGVGSGGTGGFASGPITGFGSVIVNGVVFDDSAAVVEDFEGGRRSRDELRLGMTVEIESDAISTGATGSVASARSIRIDSELLGPVASVNVAGGSFEMLGQRVRVSASTVFDEALAGGLAGLAVGQRLEVYAVFDPAEAAYRATRVEAAGSATGLRLRGPISRLDVAARTLRIGGADYSYASAGSPAAGLAVGQYVRLNLALGTGVPVRWVVQGFGAALREWPDSEGAKFEGLITDFTSAASFQVNGRLVTAATAAFPDGTAGLRVGTRVKVEGRLRAGVLQAAKVEIDGEDEGPGGREFRLTGMITAVDAATRRFTLRGQTVSTTRSDLEYRGGTAADLRVGARVEVRGRLSADRRSVEATRIEFD